MVAMRLPFLLISSLAFGLLATASPTASASSVHEDTPNFTYTELYDLLTNFWDSFLYPADLKQAKAINSTIFAENVQGRIDVTRTFNGRELNTEYLYGLFSNLAASTSSVSLLGVPISYSIRKFTGSGYISSATTRVDFKFSRLGGIVVPIDIDTWTSWNAQGQMTQYDGVFKWWQWLQDYVLSEATTLLKTKSANETVAILTEVLAEEICATAQTYCTGKNQQYTNSAACKQHLTQEVRFGEAYEFGRNTLVCRLVHQNMVPFRPSVHCQHIGPTGGGYCTDDMTYVDTVTENYFEIPWNTHR